MKATKYILITLAGLLLASCEKELDFEYLDIEPLLVIEGSLTETGAEVSLTWTTPMDEPMDKTRVTDATVSITDLTTGSVEMLTPDAEGLYRNATGGIIGHEYELRVERDGEVNTSRCEMLPATEITGLEFSWISMPYDEVAILDISFKETAPGYGEHFWVRITKDGEPYQSTIMSDLASKDGIIDLVVMTTRKNPDDENDDMTLKEGDELTVTITPISENMAYYFEALGNDSNGQAMFTGKRCLGYFLAGPVAEGKVVFRADRG